MSTFIKATKKAAKLRLFISAPSGAGKTFSALRIATGIISYLKETTNKETKIGMIDTERHSASKYSDRFTFYVADLANPTINNYIQYINNATEFDVLIIDSITHAWQTLLDEVEKLAKAKYKGNTFRAWSEGTPKQREFINAILNFPGHIIATARAKTEYVMEDQNGKKVPVKVGMGVEQGKGIEYEFDMIFSINHEHYATVEKDRTGKYQDAIIEKPGEDLGKVLAEWLSDGLTPEQILATALKEIKKAKSLSSLKEIWNDNRDLQNNEEFTKAMTAQRISLEKKAKSKTKANEKQPVSST